MVHPIINDQYNQQLIQMLLIHLFIYLLFMLQYLFQHSILQLYPNIKLLYLNLLM